MLEFLKKFVIPTVDIEIIRSNSPEQDSFVVRSKELLRQFTYLQQQQLKAYGTSYYPTSFSGGGSQSAQPQNTGSYAPAMEGYPSEEYTGNPSLGSSTYVPNHRSLYGASTHHGSISTQHLGQHLRYNTDTEINQTQLPHFY